MESGERPTPYLEVLIHARPNPTNPNKARSPENFVGQFSQYFLIDSKPPDCVGQWILFGFCTHGLIYPSVDESSTLSACVHLLTIAADISI